MGVVVHQISAMSQLARELEEAVIDAWPAAETEDLDGWLLRASGGPTHRGNSVATCATSTRLPLAERIDRAEDFYRKRGLSAMFQVGPCAAPAGLDDALAERGYQIEGAAVAAVTTPRDVLALLGRSHETSVAARASDAWLEVVSGASRFAATAPVFQGFLGRLGSRCRFVTTRDARGTAIAVCLAIASEDRLGVYAMLTLPGARRKGAAAALLRAVAESAAADDMHELYLLVEEENTAARALYAKAGFVDVYRYHYRTRAAAELSPDAPIA
jgi:ribosomal protein S18 acetylase RimI-like enzyme